MVALKQMRTQLNVSAKSVDVTQTPIAKIKAASTRTNGNKFCQSTPKSDADMFKLTERLFDSPFPSAHKKTERNKLETAKMTHKMKKIHALNSPSKKNNMVSSKITKYFPPSAFSLWSTQDGSKSLRHHLDEDIGENSSPQRHDREHDQHGHNLGHHEKIQLAKHYTNNDHLDQIKRHHYPHDMTAPPPTEPEFKEDSQLLVNGFKRVPNLHEILFPLGRYARSTALDLPLLLFGTVNPERCNHEDKVNQLREALRMTLLAQDGSTKDAAVRERLLEIMRQQGEETERKFLVPKYSFITL